MNERDVRWKQRFQNFNKALESLTEIINISSGFEDDILIDATIQRYEITFDLGWKLLQDYLVLQGYSEYKGPRKAIVKSYQDGIIDDGEGWAIMHEDRNVLSHNYDYEKSRVIYQRIITDHINLLTKLKNRMSLERAE